MVCIVFVRKTKQNRCDTDGMVRSFIMVCWVGWEQLREMVWYGAGVRELGDGTVTGDGTEIKVPIPSHLVLMGIPSQHITT